MNITTRLKRALTRQMSLSERLDQIQSALGRIESRQCSARPSPPSDVKECEFQVYSQWGEDGIIDYLVNTVPLRSKTFIEFGVQDYTEANTIFLLKHRYWRGLVIDGSAQNIAEIQRNNVYWRYDLKTDASFITKDNIDQIISRNGFAGEIGLLSIDIDGNDYWVWEAIESVNPGIVVCEYNSLFGPTAKITVPYSADFHRTTRHQSNTYYGASISALAQLGNRKGFTLVGGNSAGNNIFFVRNDLLNDSVPTATAESAYVQAGFREAYDAEGNLINLSFASRQEAIAQMPVVELSTMRTMCLREAL